MDAAPSLAPAAPGPGADAAARSSEAAGEAGALPPSPGAHNIVTIHNVVATANFGCTLDIVKVAWTYHGEYNPNTFAAVQLRLSFPRTTALVFASGNVVCTGCGGDGGG